MQFPLIQNLFAERVRAVTDGKNYVLNKVEKYKRTKLEAIIDNPHTSLIDLSMSEPASQINLQIIDALYQGIKNLSDNDNACPEFVVAAAQFMQRVFGVLLDPTSEIIPSISSKSALSILLACFINPGDVVLSTKPGYSICDVHTKHYGGIVHHLPLQASNGYFPDLNNIPKDLLMKAKVFILNYPNYPTGACATFEFFEKVVSWAKAHNIMIIQDATNASLMFENQEPLSILKIKNAKEVAIEIHSLTMPSWRMAWICGNPLIIKAFSDIKENTDSALFLPIHAIAAKVLMDTEAFKPTILKYSRRMDLLFEVLKSVGFNPIKPKAGFVYYCNCPKSASNGPYSIEYYSAFGFSQWLVRNELICTTPWDDVAPSVGFSVAFQTTSEAQENKLFNTLAERLIKYKFKF